MINQMIFGSPEALKDHARTLYEQMDADVTGPPIIRPDDASSIKSCIQMYLSMLEFKGDVILMTSNRDLFDSLRISNPDADTLELE